MHQATVKCWQIDFVSKLVGDYEICTKQLWNADWVIPSIKLSVSIFYIVLLHNFKYFLNKLFTIHNIKLYKLIVKKPIMQINFLLNIKK